jgi:hypothetical protein
MNNYADALWKAAQYRRKAKAWEKAAKAIIQADKAIMRANDLDNDDNHTKTYKVSKLGN